MTSSLLTNKITGLEISRYYFNINGGIVNSTAKILVGLPEYHQLASGTTDGLIYLTMNLPTICSYRCLKCALAGSQRAVGPLLSTNERRQIITTAGMAGTKTLVIIGNGEPTENFPMMVETVSAAVENGMNIIFFSTLSHLDEEQAEFFATHDVSIIVSLDSLDEKTYRLLTGNGDLCGVLEKIRRLRTIYDKHPASKVIGKNIVRLGVNTTVCHQNISELSSLRKFCGDDMMFFVNPPMRRGRLQSQQWSHLVDNEEVLQQVAQEFSETGGHSSLVDGVCGYFSHGVSVDVDGEFLTCGYAGETAGLLGNARTATPQTLFDTNGRIQKRFEIHRRCGNQHIGCPPRDPNLESFIDLLRS